ncbi:MAG: hypothetical protein GX552_05770 [Chloroflexi bacterium]|jgi:hypothetical protein|nr:hypothetical protein [Chloroflexota bacterium]
MAKQLAVYVSASPEMDAECELLGQLLAGMFHSTQWTIKRTPAYYERMNPDLDALRGSQFYVILLGMDIMAPMGVEWMVAQEMGLPTFAFHNVEVVASPATSYFMRQSGAQWQSYRSPQEFIHQLERQLIHKLLEGTPGYGVEVSDLEELSARLKALEEQDQAQDRGEERRGAGRGGIILPSAGAR